MRLFLFSLVFIVSTVVNAQKTTIVSNDTLAKKTTEHSSRKAALLSTLLPGAGQVYNRKYWKPPVIYAALAGLGYLVKLNSDKYKTYKQAYIYRTDNDASTVDAYINKYSDDNLLTLKNSYQRSRDFNIICIAAVYVLNIVDATVDAHLYTFDVSDDLSMQLYPTFIYSAQSNVRGTGLGISFKF